jgi:hypothetical protein
VATVLILAVAYLGYRLQRRSTADPVVKPLASAREWYKEAEAVHRKYSRVWILSKTPGLLIPAERDLADFRKDYFSTIQTRLNEGHGSYTLTYLFDIASYSATLRNHAARGETKAIDEARQMLREALRHPNLDLKYGNTEPMVSIVIGGDAVAVIGFREESTKKLTEGVVTHSPELLRIFKQLYNSIASEKVTDIKFIDDVLGKSA